MLSIITENTIHGQLSPLVGQLDVLIPTAAAIFVTCRFLHLRRELSCSEDGRGPRGLRRLLPVRRLLSQLHYRYPAGTQNKCF